MLQDRDQDQLRETQRQDRMHNESIDSVMATMYVPLYAQYISIPFLISETSYI